MRDIQDSDYLVKIENILILNFNVKEKNYNAFLIKLCD